MEQSLNTGGEKDSITPSTRLLNQKLGTLHAPRMLEPSEIALLRQSKQEIARMLAGMDFRLRGDDWESRDGGFEVTLAGFPPSRE